MTCHCLELDSASDWLEICVIQSEALPDLSSDTSSVWNFYALFTDVISRGNPPVAPQNVGCLLRLGKVVDKDFFRHIENQAVIICGPQKSRDYY